MEYYRQCNGETAQMLHCRFVAARLWSRAQASLSEEIIPPLQILYTRPESTAQLLLW